MSLFSPSYLIKVHQSLTSRTQDEDVLNLAITAKLVCNVLLVDPFDHSTAPNTFCGHGSGKAQGELGASQAVAVAFTHGTTHTAQIGELDVGVTRLFGRLQIRQVRCGQGGRNLFDVNLKDLSEALKLFLHGTGGHVSREASNEQGSSGLWMELLELRIGGAVVQSPKKIVASNLFTLQIKLSLLVLGDNIAGQNDVDLGVMIGLGYQSGLV